jgi:hypothetical protein
LTWRCGILKKGIFSQVDKFGGVMYRDFNQEDEEDFKTFFSTYAGAHSGICAGLCFCWLRFYLTSFPPSLYSNKQMIRDRDKIISLMDIVRTDDISILNLLDRIMIPTNFLPISQKMRGNFYQYASEELNDSIDLSPSGKLHPGQIGQWECKSPPIKDLKEGNETIAFIVRVQGLREESIANRMVRKPFYHVAAGIMRKENKQFYLMDPNKGDVAINQGRCVEWFKLYLASYLRRGDKITLHFFKNPMWREDIESEILFPGTKRVLRRGVSKARKYGIRQIDRARYDDDTSKARKYDIRQIGRAHYDDDT